MPLTTSRLQKIGFLSQLPPKANIDDFEVITINGKSGEKLKMYRKKKRNLLDLSRKQSKTLQNFLFSAKYHLQTVK